MSLSFEPLADFTTSISSCCFSLASSAAEIVCLPSSSSLSFSLESLTDSIFGYLLVVFRRHRPQQRLFSSYLLPVLSIICIGSFLVASRSNTNYFIFIMSPDKRPVKGAEHKLFHNGSVGMEHLRRGTIKAINPTYSSPVHVRNVCTKKIDIYRICVAFLPGPPRIEANLISILDIVKNRKTYSNAYFMAFNHISGLIVGGIQSTYR